MLSESFAEYGNIVRVRLPTDRETGKMKGYMLLFIFMFEEVLIVYCD